MRINKSKSFGSLLDGVKTTQVKKHNVTSAIFPVIISKNNNLLLFFIITGEIKIKSMKKLKSLYKNL